ncbi:MAG: hypothetical protein KBONHNOK_00443 [Candidatus Methanoperedenaceae archaeon GB50]|nr:MAG: hypothetical protein KBONHNOK_00443 [Candidatus Methanoperedenaceae archaeon GB50]
MVEVARSYAENKSNLPRDRSIRLYEAHPCLTLGREHLLKLDRCYHVRVRVIIFFDHVWVDRLKPCCDDDRSNIDRHILRLFIELDRTCRARLLAETAFTAYVLLDDARLRYSLSKRQADRILRACLDAPAACNTELHVNKTRHTAQCHNEISNSTLNRENLCLSIERNIRVIEYVKHPWSENTL